MGGVSWNMVLSVLAVELSADSGLGRWTTRVVGHAAAEMGGLSDGGLDSGLRDCACRSDADRAFPGILGQRVDPLGILLAGVLHDRPHRGEAGAIELAGPAAKPAPTLVGSALLFAAVLAFAFSKLDTPNAGSQSHHLATILFHVGPRLEMGLVRSGADLRHALYPEWISYWTRSLGDGTGVGAWLGLRGGGEFSAGASQRSLRIDSGQPVVAGEIVSGRLWAYGRNSSRGIEPGPASLWIARMFDNTAAGTWLWLHVGLVCSTYWSVPILGLHCALAGGSFPKALLNTCFFGVLVPLFLVNGVSLFFQRPATIEDGCGLAFLYQIVLASILIGRLQHQVVFRESRVGL